MNELQVLARKNLLDLIARHKKQIETVLPQVLKPDRFLRLLVGEIDKNPTLAQCTQFSFINAVAVASSLGLEIRANSAYLVPFNVKGKMTCTLMIDYRGKMELARRSGQVSDIDAEIVYAKEKFKIVRDMQGKRIEHEPLFYFTAEDGTMIPLTSENDRGEPIGAYAVAGLRNGPPHFVFLPKMDILKIRDMSKNKSEEGPWRASKISEMEMWKKTVIHRLCKLLPMSPELALAQEIDDRKEQGLDLETVIECDVVPQDEEPIVPQSLEAAAKVGEDKLAELRQKDAESKAAREAKRRAGPIDAGSLQGREAFRELAEEEMRAQERELMQAEEESQEPPEPPTPPAPKRTVGFAVPKRS